MQPGDQHVPNSLAKDLLVVFQTSSSTTFNSLFRHKEISALKASITQGNAANGDPNAIINQAKAFYMMLLESNERCNGVIQTTNPSTLLVDSKRPCFNCGLTNCNVSTCQKPKHKACIKANKKVPEGFFHSKQG